LLNRFPRCIRFCAWIHRYIECLSALRDHIGLVQ
jgi:hypothetical protein